MQSSGAVSGRNDYRADIDGLRAIAVLSVIAFHIHEAILPGGFVGVDIFFVISGYLISLHIFKDMQKQRFSLVEFYRRRIKRIAPAMFVVVLATVVMAQFFLRPIDAEKTAESGLWSLISAANIYFWLFQDASYFAPASNEIPLLHLWSLGVEEQFYIFWPLILMLGFKLGYRNAIPCLIFIIAVASFLFGEVYFKTDPSFVYYMLPTRAGELLIGAGVAQFILKRGDAPFSPRFVAITAWSGMLLVFGSLILISEAFVFPGLWALPPTVGVALLILSGNYGVGFLQRILMLPPMVWVGKISYSAYLWHWPILAFMRYAHVEMTVVNGIMAFVATICLAWLSFRYVEVPARKTKASAWFVFQNQFAIPCAVIAFVSLTAMKLDGYGVRWFSDDYRSSLSAIKDQTKPAYKFDYVCQSQVITLDDAQNMDCVVGDKDASSPSVIVWGDSNAAHYVGMLGVFAREGGFRFRNLQIGSCPPLISDPVDYVSPKRSEDCRASVDVVKSIMSDYQVIIISASWTYYQGMSAQFLENFFNDIEKLLAQGKQVVLIGKAPVIHSYDRLCREKELSIPSIDCGSPSNAFPGDVANVNHQLFEYAKRKDGVQYYDITDYLCPGNKCSAHDEFGQPLYYDSSHLTMDASWKIGEMIVQNEGVPRVFLDVLN